YTGFCPKLPEHYGQSYGKATRQITLDRLLDLERLADTRHHGFDCHCMDYADHHCGRGRRLYDHRDHDRNGVVVCWDYASGIPNHIPHYSHGLQKHDWDGVPHVHHPAFMTEACQHDMHPGQAAYDRQLYDPRMQMKSQKVPFRNCCVTPKYTGHIPGMQFIFGESFGPSSDRLLRRHHEDQHLYD
ncbi:hypothetical protein AVEN_43003-1, partial [Araneus ventricosus]